MTHLDPAHRSAVQPSIPTTTTQVDGAKSESTPKPQPTPNSPVAMRLESGTASTTHEAVPVPVQVPSGEPRTESSPSIPTAPTFPDAPPMRSGPPRGAPPVLGAKPTTPKPTGPTTANITTAFKNPNLKPENFKRPDSMNEDQLADACLRMNNVIKSAGDLQSALLRELMNTDGPFHGLVQTGEVDAGKLDSMAESAYVVLRELKVGQSIDEGVREHFDPEGMKPTVHHTHEQLEAAAPGKLAELRSKAERDFPAKSCPSAADIRKSMESGVNWQTGKDMGVYAGVKESAHIKMGGWREVSISETSLKQANEQLAAKGAFIRLVPTGAASDGFVSVRPEWNGSRTVTSQEKENHSLLAAFNAKRQETVKPGDTVTTETGFVSWADCHRTAQTIMGSEDTPFAIMDREHILVGGKTVAPLSKAAIGSGSIAAATDHGSNRGMHALFNRAMPEFAKTLREKPTRTPAEDQLIRTIDTAVTTTKTEGAANFRQSYRQIVDNPALAALFGQQFGVNGHATPKVGQAFAQINDEYEKANAKGRDLWNFHFAGVVMVDTDGSYLTLENLSTEDSSAVNDNWYFRLYNSDRNFHAENKTDTHVGGYPLTALFEYVAPPASTTGGATVTPQTV
jgi:hypothetical protein